MTRRMHHRAAGWSLVELAVVLVVIGAIGLVLWRVLPLAPQVAAGDAARRDLARAEQALLGYALAHSRLPEPITDDGINILPAQALGLPTRLKLRYQVQPSLTNAPANVLEPRLPPATLLGGSPPMTSAAVNGLDLCMRLKVVSTASLGGMQGVPTAFALMHPAPAGHGPGPTASGFVLPGSGKAGSAQVLAVGPGEFASRLACPDRVARTHAAASAAYAAYDIWVIATLYHDFRTFAVQVAKMNEDAAQAGLTYAIFDVVWGVFSEALAIVMEAAGWPPGPFAIAVGVASHITATAQLALAMVNLDGAIAALEDAEAAVTKAEQQETLAQANELRMESLADQTLAKAQQLDNRGLQP